MSIISVPKRVLQVKQNTRLPLAVFFTVLSVNNFGMAQTKSASCPPVQPRNQREALMMETMGKAGCWGRDGSGNLIHTSNVGPDVYAPRSPEPRPELTFKTEPPSPLDPAGRAKPPTFEGSWILIIESFSQSRAQHGPDMISFAGRVDLVPDPISKGYRWNALPDCSGSSEGKALEVSADGTFKAGETTMKLVKLDGTHLISRTVFSDSDALWVTHFVRVAKGDITGVEITRAAPNYFTVTFKDTSGRNYMQDLGHNSGSACRVYLLPGAYRFLYGNDLVPGTFTKQLSISTGSVDKLSLPPFSRR